MAFHTMHTCRLWKRIQRRETLNNCSAHPTSDRVKTYCDILSSTRSRTHGSSSSLSSFDAKLNRAIMLLKAVNNCSSFQIQLFSVFICKLSLKSTLWLTVVVSLASQIIWKIVTKIVISFFWRREIKGSYS